MHVNAQNQTLAYASSRAPVHARVQFGALLEYMPTPEPKAKPKGIEQKLRKGQEITRESPTWVEGTAGRPVAEVKKEREPSAKLVQSAEAARKGGVFDVER